MQVDSLQPQIIENAKGLYVSFSIVGVLLGLAPQPAALSATIGDIAPASTAEVRFLLTSTLAVRTPFFRKLSLLGLHCTALV